MPKVSVIIPIYGVEKYIERCAVSLFEQTLDNIEYIFVNDCTPDRTMEILESIIEKYRLRLKAEKKTVRIEQMPTNSGQAAVRKYGIQLCTGDYIIHCDSDDWVDTNMYRAMYEKALNEQADIVVCDFARTDGKNFYKVVRACDSTNKDQFINGCIYQKNSWALWNKLVKRELYNDNIIYPTEAMGEDMVLCLQTLAKCSKIAYVNDPLYKYYYHISSITKNRTIESCEKNYLMLKSNTDIIVRLIRNSTIAVSDRTLSVNFLRFINALTLQRVLYIDKYKKKWKLECRALPILSFMKCRDISLYCKRAYIFIAIGIWPTKSMRIK